MMPRFVVAGTDTGIGKTIFSAALAAALDAFYWKPIQSGLSEETDSETVERLGRLPPTRVVPEAYRLRTPASPHIAASIDGVRIDAETLSPPATGGPLIIEGAGGLLVPLTENTVFADVFARWRIPVILCTRATLGTINHTLLSLEALRARAIPVFGIACIGESILDTESIIARVGRVRSLGRLPKVEPLTPARLRQTFHQNFDVRLFRGELA
jgi:dethiobiotin synthetase